MTKHSTEYLTAIEIQLIEVLGEVATEWARNVVGDGPTREHDINEFLAIIHIAQARIMAQAASRAYPGLYRLAGETVVDPVLRAMEFDKMYNTERSVINE